jgi:phosphocarrier protein HPr
MVQKTVIIKAEAGIHARPASLLVQKASSFPCDLTLQKGEKSVNLKSIMGVMSLGIHQGEEVRITANGEGEEEALETIVKMIEEMR